jgi:hypothetical protein
MIRAGLLHVPFGTGIGSDSAAAGNEKAPAMPIAEAMGRLAIKADATDRPSIIVTPIMRPEAKKLPVRATPGAAGAIVGLLGTTAQAAYLLVLKAE